LQAQGPSTETPAVIKALYDEHTGLAKVGEIYAQILGWSTESPEGRQLLEEMSAKFPQDAILAQKYAQALVVDKKYPQAIKKMDELIALKPDDLDLQFERAKIIASTGEHESAVRELKQLRSKGYTKKEAAVMLGDELRMTGQDEEALKIYQEVTNDK
jgi:predicted Zn-dependent protease